MVTPKGDGVTVLAIVITMMALSVIAVVVRVLVRVHRHAFGLDDTFMIAGLVSREINPIADAIGPAGKWAAS